MHIDLDIFAHVNTGTGFSVGVLVVGMIFRHFFINVVQTGDVLFCAGELYWHDFPLEQGFLVTPF